MDTLSIRPFAPNLEEYEAVVAIYNANWPDERQYTADLWRDEDDEWPERSLNRRFVAESEGRIVGVSGCYEKFWAHRPGTVHIYFYIDPDYKNTGSQPDPAGQMLDHLVETLGKRPVAARVLATEAREDKPERIALLRGRGFVPAQRSPRASMDVTRFDPALYRALFERLAAQGIVIRTLKELQRRDASWKQELYNLRWAIVQDVPSVEPPTKPTMAEFEQMILEDPALDEAAWFIALDESRSDAFAKGRYIGLSNLWLNDPERERLDTGITGVLRGYRRRGIATALKVCTVNFARELGALTIDTGNEENNPMFALNLKLGFRPKAAWVSYRWEAP